MNHLLRHLISSGASQQDPHLAVNSLLGRLLLALVVSGTLQGGQVWSTGPELLGVGGSGDNLKRGR